jgi:iron complex outermembrane recepter protein
MKRISAWLALAVSAMPLFAQYSVRGTVMDANDRSLLPGANVVIEGTFQGGHTGGNGRFQLDNLNEGTYIIVVSYVGYHTSKKEIDIDRNLNLEILLEPSAILSQEVIVSATRADSRTPSTHSNVSRDEIMSRNLGQDIPFLLNMTPSLITSSDAGAGVGYSWMNIRGSDNSRINVTLNGIPLNDSESHGVWWVNMPDIASSTENIQIQRGVGTSTQGAASFGATISMNTTGLNRDPYAEIFSSGGSFNTLRNTANFGTGLLANNWAFDGRLSRITSDGYVDRSFSDLKSFYLSGGFYGKNTVIQAITFSGKETTYQAWNGVPSYMLESNRTFNPSGMYFDQDGNMQFYDNETDNYQQDHYQLHITQRVNTDWVANTSFHYTYGRGYYEQFRENDRFSRYGLPNVIIDDTEFSRTDLIRQRWLDNHFYGLTWSANYKGAGRLNATLGGGYNVYEGDHYGKIIWARLAQGFDKDHRYYDNNAQKSDFNSFVKMNYEVAPGLYVFGDMQYRNIIYDFVGLGMVENEIVPLGQTARFDFFNPKTGFVYEISSQHNVYTFAGISNREPVRRDFTESSPDSRPRHETLRNLEVGYRYSSGKLKTAINYYLMDYKDQLILTGEINDVGGFSRTNIDDSYRMGVELEAAYRFNRMIDWSGNLTLSRNKIPEFIEYSDQYDEDWNWTGTHVATYENTDIAFSPSLIGASRIGFYPLKGATIGFMSKYVGSQYIDNTMNKDRMLDAYFVNDLKLAYKIENSFFRGLELSFLINNLFDVDYITNAWIYKGQVGDSGLIAIEDGYFPQAGRHFLLGARLKL